MPIYEYSCQECHREILGLGIESTQSRRGHLSALRRLADGASPVPICRSQVRRGSTRITGGSSQPRSGLDENDPRSVARLMKKMGEEMGEDVERYRSHDGPIRRR